MKPAGWVAALVLAAAMTGCATLRESDESRDQWFAEDKAQHFSYSAATALGTTWSARAAGVPGTKAAAGGFTVTITGGALKELWDATAPDGSGWSWKDLAWDLAGTTLGTLIGASAPVSASN